MAEDLEIHVLGELEVRRGGVPLALPPSRKSRALLAFLAVQRAPQRRDALCELFWELPDDPRAALRWSLTKLRGLLNDEHRERLTADRERVYINLEDVVVDLHLAQAARGEHEIGRLDAEGARKALALFRGPFLAGLDLTGELLFESWRLGQQERIRRLHLDLLEVLTSKIDHASHEYSALLRRQIELDPGDESAHARLIAALATSGATAEADQQKDASTRMLAELGPFDERALDNALHPERRRSTRGASHEDMPPRQEVRFCTSRDGVRIAYATVGDGAPLLKTANWLNHLEFDWESPVWRHFFRAFSAKRRLVRYDSRGNGLSDWEAKDLSLDAMQQDLLAVADGAGLKRFPLLAISQGCAVAIGFAVRYPERVSKLVLYGGYARGWRKRGDVAGEQQQQAMITLARLGWGKDNPAFRQMFTSSFIPGATAEQMDWFNQLQRVSTSGPNAARILEAFGEIDVTPLLREVRVPTLVIHARDDARVPLNNGIELASGIPGARLLTLDGQNHLILAHEPAWPRFVGEVEAFLSE
jgi:DNA-binding SARP family transcriptional activator/alpha-beta hydrolase superfamily lysophospholipase